MLVHVPYKNQSIQMISYIFKILKLQYKKSWCWKKKITLNYRTWSLYKLNFSPLIRKIFVKFFLIFIFLFSISLMLNLV